MIVIIAVLTAVDLCFVFHFGIKACILIHRKYKNLFDQWFLRKYNITFDEWWVNFTEKLKN